MRNRQCTEACALGVQGKLSFEAVQQLATEELLEQYIDSRCGPGRTAACTACGLSSIKNWECWSSTFFGSKVV